MRGIKALIFDLDGVIADTRKANLLAYELALKEMGFHLDPRQFLAHEGLPFDQLISRISPGLSLEKRIVLKGIKSRHYRSLYSTITINHSLIGFIEAHKSKMTIMLASNASRDNGLGLLKHFGLINLFDLTLFREDVANPKPHPECYLTCINLLKLCPTECIIFEDSECGLLAATRSKANVIKILPWSEEIHEKERNTACCSHLPVRRPDHQDIGANGPEVDWENSSTPRGRQSW